MNEVALKIGGRTYRVACAPGDEDRVSRLGATIAEKLASIGNPAGPDAQNLLLAALLLADEVQDGRDAQTSAGDTATGAHDDLTARIADLEAELAQAKSAASDAADEARSALERQAELQQTVSAHEIAAEDMRGEIAGLRNTNAASPAGRAGGEDLASLAPALERLAEMLEDCADKLERRPAST